MKAILEFNLPEDEDDFKRASRANQLQYVIWKLDHWLRSQTKYADDNTSQDTYNAYQDCRDMLCQLLNQNDVNFE